MKAETTSFLIAKTQGSSIMNNTQWVLNGYLQNDYQIPGCVKNMSDIYQVGTYSTKIQALKHVQLPIIFKGL